MLGFLFFLVAWVQDGDLPELIQRLDDDDLAVREAAAQAILKKGARVIPTLEGALKDPSPEMRGRVVEILERFPEYAVKAVMRHPDFPQIRRLWNALIETLIHKRPIPKAAWKDVEEILDTLEEELPEQSAELFDDTAPSSCSGEIASWLRNEGARILSILRRLYGVEGMAPEPEAAGPQKADHEKLSWDFLVGLLTELGPDEATFEELYGTILLLHDDQELRLPPSKTDFQRILEILVHIRKRPGASPRRHPQTREEAMSVACRGPWLRGIADALGRAFQHENENSCILDTWECGRVQRADTSGPSELRRAYETLLQIDRQIGLRYYHPRNLQETPPDLPRMRGHTKCPPGLEKFLDGLEPEERRVVEALLPGVPGWEEGAPRSDMVRQLLRSLGRRVAELARAAKSAQGLPK